MRSDNEKRVHKADAAKNRRGRYYLCETIPPKKRTWSMDHKAYDCCSNKKDEK